MEQIREGLERECMEHWGGNRDRFTHHLFSKRTVIDQIQRCAGLFSDKKKFIKENHYWKQFRPLSYEEEKREETRLLIEFHELRAKNGFRD